MIPGPVELPTQTSASLTAGFAAEWPPCVCCGRDDSLRLLRRFADAEIVGCARCGHAMTVPEAVVRQSGYESNPALAAGFVENETLYRRFARQQMAFVRCYVKGGSLLDVGCSVGYLVEEAARLGFRSLGVDTDPAAIEAGRIAGRDVRRGDAETAPIGPFDGVLLSHVLEHQREPDRMLTALKERLRPGGLLFLWLPNCRGLLPRLAPALWYGWQPHQHYHHYSPDSLRDLVERMGFDVIRVKIGSMSHRLRVQPRWQDTVKQVLCCLLARIGRATGRGDEIALVARRPEGIG